MFRHITLAATLLAGFSSMPAFAAGDAAAGLKAMKETNLIVLGDWQTASDVGGKVIVFGDASGQAVDIGVGHATQGALASGSPTLVLFGKSESAEIKIANGTNGSSGHVASGPSAIVGGNVKKLNLKDDYGTKNILVGGNFGADNLNLNGSSDFMSVGGKVNANMTVATGATVRIGGTRSGALNGSGAPGVQTGLGTGFNSSAVSTALDAYASVKDDVKALSTDLAALTLADNPSFLSTVGQTLVLNAEQGTNGFSLFNLSQADLAGKSSLAFNFDSTGPVIINFSGDANITQSFTTLNGSLVDPKSLSQQVIWNFFDAASVKTHNEFYGSVLAPLATVNNGNAIDGSVVAGTFQQHGEVHLGTYNLDLPTPPVIPSVPEPASWAMMIAGFGLAGAAYRRRANARVQNA